jgi:gamma-glutamyl hercynylcysteine S-oxide synthase
MSAPATAVCLRHDLHERLLDARSRTDELFELVRAEALYDRPIPQRYRIIFYLGHVEAFDWNLLADRAFGLQPFQRSFDNLFARGIDPADGHMPVDNAEDWPSRSEIERYNRRVRDELDHAIERGLARPEEGHPNLPAMIEAAIEHRLTHAETLTYMLHQLPASRKHCRPEQPTWKAARMISYLVEIPAGWATLGLRRVRSDEFGWDNEFGAHEVNVPKFAIENYNVTNREYLRFIQAGGYESRNLWSEEGWAWRTQEEIKHPIYWKCEGNLWVYRTMFGEVRLPMEWPVYVSQVEASAYAKWLGRKLPTEAQFHRAAYGTPGSRRERSYPWGEDFPTSDHGNFDFRSWYPSEVGAHPAGASAFGVQDLVGNGWEWTRSTFEAFPGYGSLPFYPQYSAKFFDGKHFVLKGASPRTAACLLRRSFRNWFRPNFPYAYATFRCVED